MQKLKVSLAEPLVLAYPELDGVFVLDTDAIKQLAIEYKAVLS